VSSKSPKSSIISAAAKNNSKHSLQIIEEEGDAYYRTLKSNEEI